MISFTEDELSMLLHYIEAQQSILQGKTLLQRAQAWANDPTNQVSADGTWQSVVAAFNAAFPGIQVVNVQLVSGNRVLLSVGQGGGGGPATQLTPTGAPYGLVAEQTPIPSPPPAPASVTSPTDPGVGFMGSNAPPGANPDMGTGTRLGGFVKQSIQSPFGWIIRWVPVS